MGGHRPANPGHKMSSEEEFSSSVSECSYEQEQEQDFYYNNNSDDSDNDMTVSDNDSQEGEGQGTAGDAVDELDALPIAQPKKPLLTAEDLASFNKTKDRTGVVFISRIPRAMTPAYLRQLLAPFGQIGRVYLAPDKKAEMKAKKLPKKQRKNLKLTFTEGWIEFLNKRDAKTAAEVLNGRRMVPEKKHSRFAEDLWCIKYLGSSFKWTTLTERIAYERAVSEQRMREELSQARRENKHILRQAELAKTFKKIEEKRAAKKGGEAAAATTVKREIELDEIKKRFRQRQPINN